MGLGPEEIVIVWILQDMYNLGFHILILSSGAMERREDSRQRMLGSLPRIDSQFVGLCAEL